MAPAPVRPPAPAWSLTPGPLPGDPVSEQEFEIWTVPGLKTAPAKVGASVVRRSRYGNEIIQAVDTRLTASAPAQPRGGADAPAAPAAPVTELRSETYVEDLAGRPRRFVLTTRREPGGPTVKTEGHIERGRWVVTVGSGPGAKKTVVDAPAGSATLLALRRALVESGLEVGKRAAGEVFPWPEEPERPHNATVVVEKRERIDFAGRTVEVFELAGVVTLTDPIPDVRPGAGAGPAPSGPRRRVTETVWMDSAGETYRVEAFSAGTRLVHRRVR